MAPSSNAHSNPTTTTQYSATLFVATPIPSAISARTSPSPVVTTTPIPAGPGFPRAAPSVATIR